ncbi:MAG TPA: ATP-binding protein [bacterium]|nr:ATP-binding protein [bacterium]
MPTAHLICGSTGAGKTTYALDLAVRTGAVRFSIDEWMAALFWPDAPPSRVYEWALERTERCERQILAVCAQLFARGQDAILDLGFFTRVQRERTAAGVRDAGGEPRLHYLPVPAPVRWERVAQRNAQGGETFALTVTREMFDFCEGLFEAPVETELAGGVIVPEGWD